MRVWQASAIWLAAIFCSASASGQVGAVQSLDIRVPLAPQPVRIGERMHAVYELHLTNHAFSGAVTLNALTVSEANTSALIEHYEGDVFAALFGRPAAVKDVEPRSLPAGMHGVIYLAVPLNQPVTKALSHRLTLAVTVQNEPRALALDSDILTLDTTPLPELSPPLRGGLWAALYDPGMERGHRRMVYAVDGHARIPARFAIDFFGVDANGKTHRDAGERPSDYFGYGTDVLAVSDGVVVAARDDFTEPATLAAAPKRIPLGDATGAYVALDLGGGRFAFYEHLRPGLAVEVGQKVRRGERIGALGFTGQGSQPHLHFHVANANAPLAAEGMPYHFTSYRLLGRYNSITEFGEQPWRPLPETKVISKSLPPANGVVSFD